MRSINSMIDGVREPYTKASYLVKLFGKVVFSGSRIQCENFCKSRKVPLLMIPANGFSWREFD